MIILNWSQVYKKYKPFRSASHSNDKVALKRVLLTWSPINNKVETGGEYEAFCIFCFNAVSCAKMYGYFTFPYIQYSPRSTVLQSQVM